MENMIFQAWQHERNLLTSRLMIFLVTSSILFLGYVQIDVSVSAFGTIIASLGLISCFLGGVHFKGLPKRLDSLENQLPEELKVKLGLANGRIRGRRMALYIFPIFFALIWIASILHSLGVIIQF